MASINNTEIYLDARTAEQWAQVTRIIPKGFVCVELNDSTSKIKIGDGVHTYAKLSYVSGDMTEYYTKTEVDNILGDIQTALAEIVEVSE